MNYVTYCDYGRVGVTVDLVLAALAPLVNVHLGQYIHMHTYKIPQSLFSLMLFFVFVVSNCIVNLGLFEMRWCVF